MENAWFVLSHKYSMSRRYDPAAVGAFRGDALLARRLAARWVIFESYPADFAYGDYLAPWCGDTLRAMCDAAREAGLHPLPYTNATEVDIKSSVYRDHPGWLAKPPVGREYPAFISAYLPEYFREGDFFNKLVCPAGPWKEYYLDQCSGLIDNFGFEGIYVDRVDYRVPCTAHPGFSAALPGMMGELKERVRSFDENYILVINDSAKIPDRIFRDVMQHADVVLAETLPPGSLQEVTNLVMFATSEILYRLKPFTEFAIRKMYGLWGNSPLPDTRRLRNRARMLHRTTGRPVWIFTHSLTASGARSALEAASEAGPDTGICIFSPDRLAESPNIREILKEFPV